MGVVIVVREEFTILTADHSRPRGTETACRSATFPYFVYLYSQGRCHCARDLGQLGDLLARQTIDEQFSNCLDMPGSGSDQRVTAG